ncbi:hypothetical protein [Erythrobacter sp. YT30]|uniref:hypothetical protein n=1 Tax=Erythrobacter sp. YT30 TaxID=1735012 RepID=UPI0012E34F9E|nr:hypothetical protein [Erythrobacter sp. YT30]
MNTNTHTSDAEAELAGTKEDGREAAFLNPKTLKRSFKFLIFGFKAWRLAAKLWEWFV